MNVIKLPLSNYKKSKLLLIYASFLIVFLSISIIGHNDSLYFLSLAAATVLCILSAYFINKSRSHNTSGDFLLGVYCLVFSLLGVLWLNHFLGGDVITFTAALQ